MSPDLSHARRVTVAELDPHCGETPTCAAARSRTPQREASAPARPDSFRGADASGLRSCSRCCSRRRRYTRRHFRSTNRRRSRQRRRSRHPSTGCFRTPPRHRNNPRQQPRSRSRMCSRSTIAGTAAKSPDRACIARCEHRDARESEPDGASAQHEAPRCMARTGEPASFLAPSGCFSRRPCPRVHVAPRRQSSPLRRS